MDGIFNAAWHSIPTKEVLDKLGVGETGLSEEEAGRRIKEYGPNIIPERERDSAIYIFLRQFNNALIFILLFASGISLALGDFINAGIIGGAILLNALIGFFQELKVSNILRSLKKYLSYTSTVIRSGVMRSVPSASVAAGDIIVLRVGDRVPADARVISSSNLKTNEIILTGESFPVEKSSNPVDASAPVAEREDMIFMGTVVEEGVCRAVVTGIGANTEFGRIASLISEEGRKDITPLQSRLTGLSKIMAVVFLSIATILFTGGVLAGRDVLLMFLTSVSVAVAAVPEGLPVALTVILAIGARRILERGGLVRKMLAAEALGSTTVVAADKTATLTFGELELENIVLPQMDEIKATSFSDIKGKPNSDAGRRLFEALTVLCNISFFYNQETKENILRGGSIDRAIFNATSAAGFSREEVEVRYPRLSELPFSSATKYSATLHGAAQGEKIIFAMGAPEIILSASEDLEGGRREELTRRVAEFAGRGFKVLGVALRAVSKVVDSVSHADIKGLTFMGLLVFADPIRPEAYDAARVIRGAGLRPIMVTGDHLLTAAYVAKELGILTSENRLIESRELAKISIDQAVVDYDVFARVTPEDKVNIVKALQRRGEAVAMLGDGINDAPALLEADIGVALGSGADVAKDASDLVLLNDSFAIIAATIRQGRVIMDNIKKTMIFLLGSAFSEIILIAGSVVGNLPLALLPAQILWVNLIVDGLPAIALAFEGEEGDVMKKKPYSAATIFSSDMKKLIIFFSLVTDIVLFALFVYLFKTTNDLDYSRTMVFLGLGLTSLFYIFSVSSLTKPIWRNNPLGNKYLLGAVFLGVVLYVFGIYFPPAAGMLGVVPLHAGDWLLISILGIFNIAAIELGKVLFFKK